MNILSKFLVIALCSTPLYAVNAKKNEKLPLADLERFTTVIEHVNNYYVKQVDDSELFEDAIRGMLAGLDPHSAYLDPKEFAELKASTSGKFGGLGIEVTLEDGFIKIISPIDGSPAAKSGLESGDLIIRIDDTPVRDMTLTESVERMRGKPGTDIVLTVVRANENKPLKFSVTREIINVQSVKSKMLEDGYGYLRVSQFQNDTGPQVEKAIKQLIKENKGNLNGVVLDLRNNPGGVLEASVDTASAFLDKDKLNYDQVVVYTKGRLSSSQVQEKAKGKDVTKGAPLVVLVNGGSASASEIVAGALQDYKRAVVLGTDTFGKGSVQTVLPLKDKRGLKLTTALYYTPSGRSIQAEGIHPDIVVENISIPKQDDNTAEDLMIHEADLAGHLENKTQDAKNGKEADEDSELLYSDYQLYQALNTLKAQRVLQKASK